MISRFWQSSPARLGVSGQNHFAKANFPWEKFALQKDESKYYDRLTPRIFRGVFSVHRRI
jgi:hypothetical protein